MSHAANAAFDALVAQLGLTREDTGGAIGFIDDDPIVASRFRPGAATAAALAAQAAGVAAIWRGRGGPGQDISVDLRRAVVPGLRTSSHIEQNGRGFEYGRPTGEAANFFPTRDGPRIYVLRSSNYPRPLIGLLSLLGCANTTEGLTEAISQWDSEDLEASMAERKLVGVLARSREDWLAHPQGQWLAAQGPVQVDRIGDGPRRALPPTARPLSDIRVLDMSHVLAGPTCARVLAEQGAEVLRVSRPQAPDDFRALMDTGFGKRMAYIDLTQPSDRDRAYSLLAKSDVVVQSFRPGAMDRQGFSPKEVAGRRPGIIYVSVSAYGSGGPWASRGGYELVGQAVSGLAIAEGSADAPVVAATFTLNDYLSAYLAAAGVTAALLRQTREGGSYHVHVSLARTSMWLQELGPLPHELWPDREAGAPLLPSPRDTDMMWTPSVYGILAHPKPIVEYSATPGRWDRPPEPPGASEAVWATDDLAF